MRMELLNPQHLEQIMDLFCLCFQDDHYYGRIFADPRTRPEQMRRAYGPTVRYCVEHGYCPAVWDGATLVAFLLCFDYRAIRSADYPAFLRIFGGSPDSGLPYEQALHRPVDALPGAVLYCLSVAVHPRYQHMGLASGLIDLAIETHPDHHLASDVSNAASLAIYRRRSFAVVPIEPDYFLVTRAPRSTAHRFQVGDTVRVAVAGLDALTRHGISFHVRKEVQALFGYVAREAHGIPYFQADPHSVAAGALVELSYDAYLEYQRLVNVSQYRECFREDFTFYVLTREYVCPPLMNRQLAEMLPTRQAEWALIPDVFVSIPVQYKSWNRIAALRPPRDEKAEALLRELDFRTNYESGVPSDLESVDDLACFKRRIQRFYLGKLPVQITSEITEDCYDDVGEPIGRPAFVDLYLSVDKESQCAVLTWYSLASPFLLSHLMDNIIRNNLMVVENGGHINLFDYLNTRFHIVKRGTPKIFAVIPRDRDCLNPNQIASLLAAETIYPDGENFGQIVDAEITGAARSEVGMGQYDRAFVCAYTNVLLQFSPGFQATLRERLCEESISLFYIELILLDEAAIHIADREIIKLFTSDVITRPVDFLKEVSTIYDNYSKTIDFWDIQVNYPTSQKSIDMLRQAFKLREQLEFMQRNQAQLQSVFDVKCDIIDRSDSKRMDTSLAIISILAIFSAWIDGYDYIATWGDVLDGSVIHLLQRVLFVLVLLTAGYAVTHLFGGKLSLFLKTRRERKRQRRKRRDRN